MSTTQPQPHGIDLSAVEAKFSAVSYKRGVLYARRKRVKQVDWQGNVGLLTGLVAGSGGLYSTAAYFGVEDGRLAFESGECSCPVGHNCKHVVALVIVGADRVVLEASMLESGPAAAPVPAVRPSAPPARQARSTGRVPAPKPARPASAAQVAPSAPAAWESPLRALIAPTQEVTGLPLAIELTVKLSGHASTAAPRLYGRLMREAARGGWVNGQLSWGGLESWEVMRAGVRADHAQLARAIHTLHLARESTRYGYGSYRSASADRILDLSDLDGAQLWSLLDQAERLGIPLIHAHAPLGELPRRRHGELLLDVTAADPGQSGVTVAARVRADLGSDADGVWPLMFLGTGGEVLVCSGPPSGTDAQDLSRHRLQLVRLARPTPPQLQRMLLAGERLTVPAADVARFRAELALALGRVAPVVSSDGSFAPPEVVGPELVLHTEYGEGHAAELSWQWAYSVDGEEQRTGLAGGPQAAAFRDLEAERDLLGGVDLSDTELQRFGLVDGAGRPRPDSPHRIDGWETLRFSTEQLPALELGGGLTVEVVGEPPNYRDVEDSLEITLSTADVAGEQDWFDLGVRISVEGQEVVFADVFSALAEGASGLLLDDGAHFSLMSPRLQSLRELIDEARGLTDPQPDGSLRISRYQAGLWAELAALGVVAEQSEAWRAQTTALLELDELPEVPLPERLSADLRPYQRDGFAWLASLWRLGLGGILADDMGLGKTVQTLALICHALETGTAEATPARAATPPSSGSVPAAPFLVVAPTSVVPGWVTEAQRFAPGLRAVAVTDTLARAGTTIDALIAGADLVVTTYTLLRLNDEAYRSVRWAGVILDEAQYVKNHQSKTYAAARRLDAPFKLAITGTPMENNLMELWSLLSLTAPGLFPDPERFSQQYARPIERAGDAERLARLRRRIRPLMKRRTKELVAADLPAKQEQILEVELHKRHRKLYDTHLQRERQRVLGMLEDFQRNRVAVLAAITRMRQLSLHAGLVDAEHAGVPCAKLDVLMEQLADVVEGGHRALIFSQFTGFLAKARERLDQNGITYCYLDGKTRARGAVLERFRGGDDPVFLISLKAGGFGLNLTEADYCFLLDPWWNPAAEAQAIDRTHRIGQTRRVMVYRLLAKDTIEEKVSALAARKAALFSGVMDDGDLFSTAITAEDIRGLLG
jgi:superfamily II DNA or RNA helicase